MDDATRAAALARLEPLVGDWSIEARFAISPEPTRGHLTFAWELGGQFLIERPAVDHPGRRTASRWCRWPRRATATSTCSTTSTRAASCAPTAWRCAAASGRARARPAGLHAAVVRAALHGHVRRRRANDRRSLGDVARRRRHLGARLRPDVPQGLPRLARSPPRCPRCGYRRAVLQPGTGHRADRRSSRPASTGL
jgi:hypothetical protein